jgi:hypothetical protein
MGAAFSVRGLQEPDAIHHEIQQVSTPTAQLYVAGKPMFLRQWRTK